MARATALHPRSGPGPRPKGEGGGGSRRLPVATGETREDLDRVTAALSRAGIGFEVEERLADPAHPSAWGWRVLIQPEDLGRTRGALETLIAEAGYGAAPNGPGGAASPGPLHDLGGQDWLRTGLVLGCVGLALLLLWRALLG